MAPPQTRDLAGRFRELTRAAFGASPKNTSFSLWRQIAVALAAGGFMALASPFGTDHGAFELRLAYWIGLMATGTAVSNVVARVAVRLDLYERRPWVWALLVGLAITPPMTVAVWAASGVAFVGHLSPALLPDYLPPVLMVCLAMLALTVLSQGVPHQTHAAPQGAPVPAFLKRLPPKLQGAELHAVQAEDHYLRLHTSAGQDIILMRLADALSELDGLEGARVHRSWWVARAAVIAVERGEGRAAFTLKSGAVAPVSRTFARALREAGWY